MALLIRVSRAGVGESPGAGTIAAPLETDYCAERISGGALTGQRSRIVKKKTFWELLVQIDDFLGG